MTEIVLPHLWKPRPYQMNVWRALEAGARRVCCVWHRRAGKDAVGLNWTAVQAFTRPGLYWHVLPTYRQGRKVVWEGLQRDGRSFMSAFPKELVTRVRDDEMTTWLEGGSMHQVVGAEDVDRLVGANPVGVVMSEYSLHNPEVWDYLRPILAENGGWALFLYTPRGRNHGWNLYEQALDSPYYDGGIWYAEILTVDDTNAIPKEAIEDDRRSGMPEELIQQEFYCSFSAALVGSYYGDRLSDIEKDQRICAVPWNPEKPVMTGWDLGIGDSTAIWFAQEIGPAIHVIDYLEDTGKGIDHYVKLLAEKPYTYSDHHVPHDVMQRNMSGKSTYEMAKALGIRMKVTPKIALQDGINAVRAFLPRCYFDSVKTKQGLEALRSYRKEWDSERRSYRNKPRHDWSSHGADAFRTLAMGVRPAGKNATRRNEPPQMAIV
jgi:hypothetical protein